MEKLTVAFDLFGVLTKEPMFATNIVYPLVKSEVGYDLFKKKYTLWCVGLIEEDEFFHGIVPPDSSAVQLTAEVLRQTVANDDMVRLVQTLAPNTELLLASEAPSTWGRAILDAYGIEQSFAEIHFSSDIGATKPFRGFYDATFRHARTGTTFIDDTYVNLREAIPYGIKPIWFNGDSNIKNDIAIATNAVEVEQLIHGQ